MKAIRGATTISKDCVEEIKDKVNELLSEIKNLNNLNDDNIICIMFSSTSDIQSYYPAKAAREAGFVSCALYSSLEPSIEGALKRCIRIMVFADIETSPKHVYLNEAKSLRNDITEIYNIALDGPAGSGKSTVARIIAKKLNILCLDTGAMYRACALKCLKENIDISDEQSVFDLIQNINIEVKHAGGSQITLLDGENVSADIRKPEISMLASTVSAIGCVRSKMVYLQRKIAKTTSCILDGRDIGTNVLPDAKYKFYLTASADVRAKRRYDELIEKGENISFDQLKNEIVLRDEQDKNRKIAPLKQAKDAILINSSAMTIDEVVAEIITKIQEKI